MLPWSFLIIVSLKNAVNSHFIAKLNSESAQTDLLPF